MDLSMDGRPVRSRSALRFLAFGVAAVLALGGLTARMFYLQVVTGDQYTTLAQGNRTVLQAIPSTRGLIVDRNGVELVRNVATYVVRIRPADLPESQRADVVSRLAALLSLDPAAINTDIDANPGSRFDYVRIASDVPVDIANFIAESRLDLPGVDVVVDSSRQYDTGPLLSKVLGYTAPINADRLAELGAQGYQPDDLLGVAGVEASYEAQLRGVYGSEQVERDATGRKLAVLQTVKAAQPGDSLRLTIDTTVQQQALTALQWGIQTAGLKRGVVIVMNPQTGEVLAMVTLPTYDNNDFANGISTADYQALIDNPNQPLLNQAISAHYPPGSAYKLVTASGALADGDITARTKLVTKPYLTIGTTKYYDWNKRGFGVCDLYCGFGHSSDTYFFQVAAMLGIDRLGYWANEWGFGAPTGIDLPGEVSGIVPSNAWKQKTFGQDIFPGETYQAGIGQGYDVVTPIQLINAYAALANGGTLYKPRIVRDILAPDDSVVQAFQPEAIRTLDIPAADLTIMRRAARNVVLVRHTNNMVDMPIVVAGKSGTAEFGVRDAQGRLPFHTWFIAFVPKDPAVKKSDPGGLKAISQTDSDLVVLAFAYEADTRGNAAVEIVKYFLQLHYNIAKDYRIFDLLQRGNFYQAP